MTRVSAETWVAPRDEWWLGATAKRLGDAPALDLGDTRCSFAELAATSEAAAAALSGAGIARGDRIAVIAAPSRHVVEVVHAGQRIGAVCAPLAPRTTSSELAALLATIRPRLILADEAGLETVRAGGNPQSAAVLCLPELDLVPRARLKPPRPFDAGEAHSIICTSGTTGAPKAVELSHANHHASAVAAAPRLLYRTGQRWLAVLPLHHVGGLGVVLRAAILGAEVLLRSDLDGETLARMLGRGDIAHASLVPTMLHRMLPHVRGSDLVAGARSCCLLVGGAQLDDELARRVGALGLDVRATYGMTETASQVATTARDELAEHPGSSGCALDGVDLRVDAPDREGFGDLHVRGAQVAAGYLDSSGARHELRHGDWLATGDSARVDGVGRLFVGCRRTDLIITGGENVRPEEVERVLEAHPAVAEAGVYGYRDAEWGQRVAALVVPRDRSRIDADEILAWCRSRLAPHKLPRVIDTTTSLPRTASGKLQRGKLGDARRR